MAKPRALALAGGPIPILEYLGTKIEGKRQNVEGLSFGLALELLCRNERKGSL